MFMKLPYAHFKLKTSHEAFSISLLHSAVSNLKERKVMDTKSDPNTSEQSARWATNQTTTTERMEKNK